MTLLHAGLRYETVFGTYQRIETTFVWKAKLYQGCFYIFRMVGSKNRVKWTLGQVGLRSETVFGTYLLVETTFALKVMLY